MFKLPCALSEINGNEIIDFLNSKFKDDAYDDTMLCINSFKFGEQILKEHNGSLVYRLRFDVAWNNWGRHDVIGHNVLYITHDKVWVSFEDPVSGDGTEDVVVGLLKEWLPTHTFSQNNKEIYQQLVDDIQDDMVMINFYDLEETPAIIDEIIEKLTKAKTYIKKD